MSNLADLKKTPLYGMHEKYGGKIIDFGGWALPVQYSGIIEEHRAVRSDAGLFDVSHMGEIEVRGPQALELVNYLITNNATRLSVDQVLYSPMCYPDGGVVDDLLVYRLAADHLLLVVNAGNADKDWAWIREHAEPYQVELTNKSVDTAQLALQGPKAELILQGLTDLDLSRINYFWFKQLVPVAGIECLVSRTGYTGEDGFELYCAAESGPELWEVVMEAGADHGLVPVGLGARDTLRFEACMPLYGQELTAETNPLEAKLGYFVDLDKDDFIGKDALVQARESGLQKRLVGFEVMGRGIPRTHYPILKDGQVIGEVTSGSYAPSLDKNVGLGYVPPEFRKWGTEIKIRIRNREADARVVKTPFYKREGQ